MSIPKSRPIVKKSVGIYKFTFKKVTIEIIVNNWLINMLAVSAHLILYLKIKE